MDLVNLVAATYYPVQKRDHLWRITRRLLTLEEFVGTGVRMPTALLMARWRDMEKNLGFARNITCFFLHFARFHIHEEQDGITCLRNGLMLDRRTIFE